ncbi:MAG: hypothetical protein ABID87_00550 [Chloroflexota bacterium]
MFWKKKQIVAAPVAGGTTPAVTLEKPKLKKLRGPVQIPGPVGKYLTAQYKVDPEIVLLLRAVLQPHGETEKVFSVRIFDESEVQALDITVADYKTLDQHPELVLYEGTYDDGKKQAQMTEKRKLSTDTRLFTEAEIQQKVEALNEPGSSVFFFQARGPAFGGPLGRGAAVVELNPGFAEKKGKKYIISTVNVVGIEPVSGKQRLFDSNKAKEVAQWVKEAHHKRTY